MIISKRKYYRNFYFAMNAVGVLLIAGALMANKMLFHMELVEKICLLAWIGIVVQLFIVFMAVLIKNRGLKRLIQRSKLLNTLESNLLSIGAYEKDSDKNYAKLPKIKIKEGTIRISLKNVRIRSAIEKYLDSFSTALPKQYIVEDYYIAPNNAEIIIQFVNLSDYKKEEYSLSEYKAMIQRMNPLELYFDRKHIVNVNDYPHFLVSGTTGSGKSYFVNEVVVQAIIKGWEVAVLDIKRSYGLYQNYIDYRYEVDDIMDKLLSVEKEMLKRLEDLQPELDKNPRVLAVDMGYKPMMVVVEEFISLQSLLDKKTKEELERVVRNISALARQSNIHLFIVLQSASTENIQSTTRSNLQKILFGNAQSNILNATFGNGVDIPSVGSKLSKGEGLIQLERISVLRVPKVTDIENFKEAIGSAP